MLHALVRERFDERLRKASVRSLKAAVLSVQTHARTFRSLVPWPALASSFEEDLAKIQEELNRRPK